VRHLLGSKLPFVSKWGYRYHISISCSPDRDLCISSSDKWIFGVARELSWTPRVAGEGVQQTYLAIRIHQHGIFSWRSLWFWEMIRSNLSRASFGLSKDRSRSDGTSTHGASRDPLCDAYSAACCFLFRSEDISISYSPDRDLCGGSIDKWIFGVALRVAVEGVRQAYVAIWIHQHFITIIAYFWKLSLILRDDPNSLISDMC